MSKFFCGLGLILLLLSGCSEEEVPKVSKEEVQEEEVQEEVEEVTAEEEVEEETEEETEEIIWSAPEKEITKNEVNIYENEEGYIQFVGYGENDDGSFEVVLKHSGELVKVDNTELTLRIIMDDSNSFELDKDDRTEIRVINGEEYHVYQSSDEMLWDRKVIRVDTSLYTDIDGNFNEEEMISIEIPDTDETFTLAGVEFFPDSENAEIDVRENEKYKITLEYVHTTPVSLDEVILAGSIEFKEDMEGPINFSFVQPQAGVAEERELSTSNNGSSFYKGSSVDFNEGISLGYPLGKDSLNIIYFTIGEEMFAFDLDTGEELDEVNVTSFPQDTPHYLTNQTAEGFMDVSGKRIYDALHLTDLFSNHGVGTDNFHNMTFAVGGYDTLSFKLGAGEVDLPGSEYDVYVVDENFEFMEGQDVPSGEILFSKKVSPDTALEEVVVDVSGVSEITIFVDTNIPSDRDEAGFIPLFIGDLMLKR